MLSIDNYPQEYINECHAKIDEQLSTYKDLITIARMQCGASEAMLDNAIESFESSFFNNMLLALDNYFSNRNRMLEMKDGNPLNEFRMLCDSIRNNGNILMEDISINYQPDNSLLKYRIGDEIKLNDTDFFRVYTAFFKEIENKFSVTANSVSL